MSIPARAASRRNESRFFRSTVASMVAADCAAHGPMSSAYSRRAFSACSGFVVASVVLTRSATDRSFRSYARSAAREATKAEAASRIFRRSVNAHGIAHSAIIASRRREHVDTLGNPEDGIVGGTEIVVLKRAHRVVIRPQIGLAR